VSNKKQQKVKAKASVPKPKRRRRQKGTCLEDQPVLEPNSAGVDVGAREMFVAVPPRRDENPVRVFATFTEDLEQLADWLAQCGVTTVAMESTGVYLRGDSASPSKEPPPPSSSVGRWKASRLRRNWFNGHELKTETAGLASDLGFEPPLPFQVVLLPGGLIIFHLILHYCIEDPGDLVRRGGDTGFGPQFGLHAPQVLTHLGLAVVQRISRLTEKLSGSVL
jgi:hypothetical protein